MDKNNVTVVKIALCKNQKCYYVYKEIFEGK